MTTACYVRVSALRQVQEGCSLDAQESRLGDMFPGATFFREEGISAGKPISKRPQGSLLIEAVERGEVKQVVAVSLSRLFRSASECLTTVEHWQTLGVSLRVLDLGIDTATPLGKFALTLLAACAEMERAQLRERTKSAMSHLRKQGRELGTGRRYRPGQAALDRIRSLTAEGWDSAAIAAQLNLDGLQTVQGHPWTERRVREARRSLTRRRGKKD